MAKRKTTVRLSRMGKAPILQAIIVEVRIEGQTENGQASHGLFGQASHGFVWLERIVESTIL